MLYAVAQGHSVPIAASIPLSLDSSQPEACHGYQSKSAVPWGLPALLARILIQTAPSEYASHPGLLEKLAVVAPQSPTSMLTSLFLTQPTLE